MTAGAGSEPRPVTVVGVDGSGRTYGGEKALAGADAIYGSGRILSLLANRTTDCEWLARARAWPSPFSDGLAELQERRSRGESVVVLATGNPMHHGIGGSLARRIGPDAVRAHPAPGAYALAAARLGWPLEDVGCLTLHGGAPSGRSVESLAQWIAPGRRLIALTSDASTAGEVAAWLTTRGFGPSRLTVLELIGGDRERIRRVTAADFDCDGIDPLNTLAIECEAVEGATWHPLIAGLPDDDFDHDGQMTKSEVRALTVAGLRPRPGATLWDVGAGCGSVGIEWLRLSPAGRVFAIEPREERRAMIESNAARFGIRLEIVAGPAPEALRHLPTPDCVFIGGGLTTPELTDAVWNAVAPGGTVAANAVTREG